MKVQPALSNNGKKGRKASPWNRGPMVDTKRGRIAFVNYTKRGKAKT